MFAVLLVVLACAQPSLAPPSAPMGEVDVRLVGPAPLAPVAPCADTAASQAAVWSDEGRAPPGRGLITWDRCGPQPSTLVLPPGSTLVLRNVSDDDLSLGLTQTASETGHAVIVPGGERNVILGTTGILTVHGLRGDATIVVASIGGVTDARGRASLAQVPAGWQQLHVLQPGMGVREVPVRVPVDDRVVLELELGPRPQL